MPARDPALAAALKKPFAEQVAFFRAKLGRLMPTARWDDLWQAEHDRAFMVAGAAKADLLADLAAAVDKAIADGETLQGFRKRFAEIVDRHGWHGWTGEATAKGRAWRTRVIYETNLITSYAAGRYAQLQAGGYDYWIYKHSDFVSRPRPHHVALDGITRRADDPFWQTYYPPNGWGCRCRVVGARGPASIRRSGGDPDKPLPAWVGQIDPKTQAPVGIDKGFAYAPGRRSLAVRRIAEKLGRHDPVLADMAAAMAQKTVQWPTTIAKAYMSGVPATTRDLLATAIRIQPETGEAARRYAERALGMRRGVPIDMPMAPYQTLGLLTTEEAARIAELTGMEVVRRELYDWAIDQYAPRHILREHGDEAAEAIRGQTAVLIEDFALLPSIINHADRIEYGGTSDAGRAVVLVARRIGGIEYVAVFEVLPKRRMLALKTMRKLGRPPVIRP